MGKRLIIYDMDDISEKKLMMSCKDDILFSARPIVNHCMGCFGCWIKTPAKCVIKDRCDVMTSYIPKCDELVVISPILYGGYSDNIKAVLDRSIGYILPYFRIVNGEMHHKMRYENPFKFNVHFYGECDEEEKSIAERLVKANAVNLGAASSSINFMKTIDYVQEALR